MSDQCKRNLCIMVDVGELRLHCSNTKMLQAMLQMIKTDDKQARPTWYAAMQFLHKCDTAQSCVVTGGSDGLSLRMQDDSRTMQAQIFLKAQVYALRCIYDDTVVCTHLYRCLQGMHAPGW